MGDESATYEQLPDDATIRDAYRAADLSGKPVIWHGQTIRPDYRPGHTTHPEIRGPLQGR